MRTVVIAALLIYSALALSAQPPVPKPTFQGDYFGEMPRAFCTVVKADPKARTLTVKLEKDGSVKVVPVKDDTELHFRDSWGELSDYFPGERVMLFMYIDDDKTWTYPRAVQDEIHVSARHGWFAKVTRIDTTNHTFATRREEKNGQGAVTQVVEKEFAFAPDVKVWKGPTPGGIETLALGDEVIQQMVEHDGKQAALEIFDRKGDDAVRAVQEARHKADQDRLGLPAYVTDLETISGSLVATVAWSGADRVHTLKVGDAVTISPEDGSKPFAAAVCSLENVDTRVRIQFFINARVVSRLTNGQSLRVFVPGTGPALPTGHQGVPTVSK